ncbi:MAG: hypothetical protein ACT4O1_09555 [Gemmatimonadota bacterium]
MRKRPSQGYAAVLGPQGLWLVEYERRPDGLDLRDIKHVQRAVPDAGAAADLLREALQNSVRRGTAELCLLLEVLGSSYDRLALPPAAPTVLQQVLQREMARRSGLSDGVVVYMPIGEATPGPPAKQELWAGTTSRAVLEALREAAQAANVEIRHVAILPSVIGSLFDELDGRDTPTAVVLCQASGTISGFFHGGKLRLILESHLPEQLDAEGYGDVVEDQIERGALYLRQQFRGAMLDAVLIAAEPTLWNDLSARIRRAFSTEVLPFGNARDPVAALLAVGAAIDAETHPAMNLAAQMVARKRHSRGIIEKLAHWSYVALALVCVWAIAQMAVLTYKEARLRDLDERARADFEPIWSMISVTRQRREEASQIEALQRVLYENGTLQTVFSSLASAAPENVQFDTLQISRQGSAWQGELAGRAESGTNAESISDLSTLQRRLLAQPGMASVEVEDFDYFQAGGVEEPASGVRFKLLFTAQEQP